MDDDEGMNVTEKTSEDSEGKDNEEIVDDVQKMSHSGMQQGAKTEAGSFANGFYTVTDCQLKTEYLGCTNDLIDLRQEGSFEMSEKANEYERKFLQHRNNDELHFSDKSPESRNSTNNRLSKESNKICNPECQMKCKVGEHSNSIPGFYDCGEHFSGFFALNELLRCRNNEIPIQDSYEDITRQFNEILLKEESIENTSPNQNDSRNQRVSPEIASVPYHNFQLEGKMPLSRRETPDYFYSELLHLLNRISKTSGERKDMSIHSNNSSLDNAGSCEKKSYNYSDLGLYSMISSKYIKLERTQSSSSSLNSSTDHAIGMQMPVLNPSSISPDGLLNNSLSPTAQIDNSSISKPYQRILSCSMELPSSSNTHSPKKCPKLNSCSSSNSSVRNKSTSCFDISSSPKGPTQISPKAVYKPKCSRELNFDESDSSGDDAKLNLSEGKENRKKRKLFDSSDTRASNAENHQNVSEIVSSSEFCNKKPRKHEENEPIISVLRPLDIVNSENSEANQSFRKRLYSNSKTSDIEQSDEECNIEKKLKFCTSSE